MKVIIYILLCLLLLRCNNPELTHRKTITPGSSVLLKSSSAKDSIPTQYSDQELEAFLDSIGHLPTQPLADRVTLFADSIFRSYPPLSRELSSQQFKVVQRAAHKGYMEVAAARRIFDNKAIDIDCNYKNILVTYKKGLIPVEFYPLNSKRFDEYALCIGDHSHCASASLYFFKGNKIIAKHDGYNRYGLNLKHYKDVDGRTVVYYRYEFTDGSGIWWNNYFFYKYNGDSLLPVLNELENGNVQSPLGFRTLWLESFVEKTNPLTIKMVYYGKLPDTTKPNFGPNLIDDSTTVEYAWNEQALQIEGQYQRSKISRAQVLSYYVEDNDLLFINTYYNVLKHALQQAETRASTLDYLSHVKRYFN